jgi:hypothetical protein
MPVFGVKEHYEYFKRAIRGIVGQSYKNWELLIICDGSSVATFNAIKGVLEEYNGGISQRIDVYQSNKRYGPDILRNFAHQYAKGNYITFHDSDDCSIPKRFEMLMNVMDDDGVIASNVCINTVYQNAPRKSRVKSYSGATLGLLIGQRKIRPPFHLPSAILSMDLFEEIGGFEPYMFGADATFAIKLGYFRELLCMPSIPTVKKALFVWNRHSCSITTTPSSARILRKCQKAQRKPLQKIFYNKLIACEICFGDSKDDVKNALMLSNNLNDKATLEKIYSVVRSKNQ